MVYQESKNKYVWAQLPCHILPPSPVYLLSLASSDGRHGFIVYPWLVRFISSPWYRGTQ